MLTSTFRAWMICREKAAAWSFGERSLLVHLCSTSTSAFSTYSLEFSGAERSLPLSLPYPGAHTIYTRDEKDVIVMLQLKSSPFLQSKIHIRLL